MRIICTICSKRKKEDKDLLPARERYIGEHIGKARKVAGDLDLPFFILSGKYGLLPDDEQIPNYDYYLEDSAIGSLAQTICGQIKSRGIKEIDFYTEGKPTWAPYQTALTKGADAAGVALQIYPLKQIKNPPSGGFLISNSF